MPGYGAGVLTPQGCLPAWVDQHFLPGTHYLDRPYDPAGLMQIITAAVNAILGALAGRWLAGSTRSHWIRAAALGGAGIVLLGLGWLWNPLLPVNTEIWTSSFVLVTSGWSLLLLGFFYALIDATAWRRLGWPLAVIGANSILIYMGTQLIQWSYTATGLLGGLIRGAPEPWRPLLEVLAMLAVQWVLLAWLCRRRIFLRI